MNLDCITIGAVVRLKSGGPPMTITGERSPGKDRHLLCTYIDSAGGRHDIDLPAMCVKITRERT